MIKMWRSVLSYFLVAIAISCGKHSGQLGIQSREKTALQIAAAEKNAAAQPSNRSEKQKKRKRKNQPKYTWWDRWIGFCRFLFPILLLESLLQGKAAGAYHATSCKLFKPWHVTSGYEGSRDDRTFTIPFTLPAGSSLNENGVKSLLSDFRTTLGKVAVWSYPEEVRKQACHLFANQNVNITSSAHNTKSCDCYFTDVHDFFSKTINSITSSKNLWPLHFEPVRNYYGFPERVKNNKYVANRRRLHPATSLIEERDAKWYLFYVWREFRKNNSSFPMNFVKEHMRRGVRTEHYYSPQSKFLEIMEKYENEPLKRIEKLQEQGVAILMRNWNLEGYCDEKPNLAKHLISIGGEFLYVADYEKARKIFSKYLKGLPLS
ncbi:hypothetical protein [Candidatus Cardinium hertigii]|uniref:Uncharacterized protein n=1 Tax=Candidatus Cardinium hertigii TaxID=247481 RepID=A0A2Z3LHP9_9BACT|nr:hypothetical protein [Candidatus Cardinium hertigii]AWN82035.1 hypothetical protein DK880_00725 [Candidatus Cardinium hertigii]